MKRFSNLENPATEQQSIGKINSNDLSRRLRNALASLVNPTTTLGRKKWTLFFIKTVIIHNLCLFLKKRELYYPVYIFGLLYVKTKYNPLETLIIHAFDSVFIILSHLYKQR